MPKPISRNLDKENEFVKLHSRYETETSKIFYLNVITDRNVNNFNAI